MMFHKRLIRRQKGLIGRHAYLKNSVTSNDES